MGHFISFLMHPEFESQLASGLSLPQYGGKEHMLQNQSDLDYIPDSSANSYVTLTKFCNISVP